MNTLQKYSTVFAKVYRSNELIFNSSAITFNLLVCSIPFTLIISSIIGFILNDKAILGQLISLLTDFFPSFFSSETAVLNVEQMITDAVRPLVERRRVFGIIGIVILSFTSLGLFTSIKHVLFKTFELEESKGAFSNLIYNFFAFGVAGGVFLFFTTVVSLYSLVAIQTINIPALDLEIDLHWISDVLAITLPLIFNISLFYTFFRYGSARRIDRDVCLFGAVFYTVIFVLAKYLFGIYISYFFTRFQSLYQSYSIIIMLGIWAYYGALAFSLSAVAARAYQIIKKNYSLKDLDIVD